MDVEFEMATDRMYALFYLLSTFITAGSMSESGVKGVLMADKHGLCIAGKSGFIDLF